MTEVIIPNNFRSEYRNSFVVWCYRNLFVPGEPKTWKIYTTRVTFVNEEDAVAFKLRFGI